MVLLYVNNGLHAARTRTQMKKQIAFVLHALRQAGFVILQDKCTKIEEVSTSITYIGF